MSEKIVSRSIAICSAAVRGKKEFRAWLADEPEEWSSSRHGELEAARNCAQKYFFGTTVARDFPDDISKIEVVRAGAHFFQATYHNPISPAQHNTFPKGRW